MLYYRAMKQSPSTQKNVPIREQRIGSVHKKWGLLVAILVLAAVLIEQYSALIAVCVIGLALIVLTLSFLQGYKQADELEKTVQLKAAAVCFVTMLFIGFVAHFIAVAKDVESVMSAGQLAAVGLGLHFIVLPVIAKRSYEK